LTLNEPALCISAEELSFRVERALGKPLQAAEAVEIAVDVREQGAGFAAQLNVARAGERGVRSLRAPSCERLTESLVLAIVVAIGSEEPPAATVPMTPPTLPPDSEPTSAPSVEPAPREAGSGPTLGGSAWIVGDTGTLPAASLGAGVGVTLAWPGVQLRAVGTVLPEREGNLGASAGSPGASIGLLAGSALACVPVALPPRLGLAACAGWELGQLSGSGTHVSTPYQQQALWSAARLDLAARWELTPSALSLEVLLTAAVPFTRNDFILKDLGSVYRPASVVGRLGLGLALAIH